MRKTRGSRSPNGGVGRAEERHEPALSQCPTREGPEQSQREAVSSATRGERGWKQATHCESHPLAPGSRLPVGLPEALLSFQRVPHSTAQAAFPTCRPNLPLPFFQRLLLPITFQIPFGLSGRLTLPATPAPLSCFSTSRACPAPGSAPLSRSSPDKTSCTFSCPHSLPDFRTLFFLPSHSFPANFYSPRRTQLTHLLLQEASMIPTPQTSSLPKGSSRFCISLSLPLSHGQVPAG